MEEMEQHQDKMKKNIQNKKIASILVLMAMIPIVLAVTGVIQTDSFFDSSTSEALTDVDSLLFNCNDSSCNSVGSQILDLNSGASNQITFEYPFNPSSTESNKDHYAHYLFKQCYMPKEFVESIWGFGATLEYDYNFNKAASCHSPIDSFSITNTNFVNEPVVVSIEAMLEADAQGAFTNTELESVPAGYEDYYSTETKITLEILNSAGNVVHTESQTYEILMDTSQNIEFSWTPSNDGDYTARVKTEITDCQCQSSFEQFSEKQFVVWEERPQDACYTIINDLEALPEFAKEGETINVNFNKISNYADDVFVKTPIPTNVTYEITDNQNNIVFSNSVLLNANANSNDTENIAFSWVPNFGGDFNIKVTGVGESSLCDGKTNPTDIAILGFFISSTQVFDVTFVISDSLTSGMLTGANVNFGSQNGLTDSAGKVIFTSNPGNYNWIVSLSGYDSKTGTTDITADITINVNLNPIEVEEDENDDGRRRSKGGGGKTTQLNFPILSAPPSEVFTPTIIDASEKEEPKSINGLVWVLIAEVLIILGVVLFLLRRRFR